MLRRAAVSGEICGWNLRKQRRRFRRTFPLAFLILALLAILGGALHPPSNYDALAYRVPRVLHWLAEGQWHWIYTDFQRVNTRACGIEWLSAPLIAFTKTDRLLFLINAVLVLAAAGAGLQLVPAGRSETPGGLALDVAAAKRLLLPACKRAAFPTTCSARCMRWRRWISRCGQGSPAGFRMFAFRCSRQRC